MVIDIKEAKGNRDLSQIYRAPNSLLSNKMDSFHHIHAHSVTSLNCRFQMEHGPVTLL